MTIPHTRPVTWPPPRPFRFAANVTTESADGCAVALLGLPDDTGVKLNFGRPGAAQGPAAFRSALARFGAGYDGAQRLALDVRVFDAGDVEPAPGDDEAALFETHRRVEAAAAALGELGLVVVGLGGGHDLTLPAVTALAKRTGHKLGGVNFDAHLDVRQRVGSGMPFRRLIEGAFLNPRHFVELGLGRFANEQDDSLWLAAHGAELVQSADLRSGRVDVAPLLNRALSGGTGFVSIDLDGLDVSVAPGVSAPNPLGLGLEHAAELAEAAGADARVLHFDVMELCPAHDVGERTARAAAFLFLTFMAGFQRRPR